MEKEKTIKTKVDEKKEARDEALKEVKMYQANDWDIDEETPEYFLLRRNKASLVGHILVGLFTVWWTIGFGNLLYWYTKREKKKIIK
jgi:hypothetical protein